MLKTRVITSIVALAVLGVILFAIPPLMTELIIGIVILAGAWEWSGFLAAPGTILRGAYVAIIGVLITALYVLLGVLSASV